MFVHTSVATDGISAWLPSCRSVRGLEVGQKLSQRRHRCGKGPSYCQLHQLSNHVGQAAPDRSFKATHCTACRRGNDSSEVTAHDMLSSWIFKLKVLAFQNTIRSVLLLSVNEFYTFTKQRRWWASWDVVMCFCCWNVADVNKCQDFGNTENTGYSAQ